MVSLGADRILARENSVTGSIGVIWQTAEFSGLMERIGVSAEAITSGPLKGKPSPFSPMTPKVRETAQQLVDTTYRWFVDLVAERRGLDRDTAASLADGRVFTGGQALDNGLVDALGGLEEARDWLAESHGVDRDLPLIEITYGEKDDFLGRFASSMVSAITGKSFLSERVTLDGLTSVWHPSL
jgi:protease-4